MKTDQSIRKDVGRNQFSVPQEVELLTRQAGLEIGACYSNSPWVQVVAFKPVPELSLAGHRSYLEEYSGKFAYDEAFSACFSKKLDLSAGEISPSEMLDWLNAQQDSDAVSLFRRHLLGVWQTRQKEWGLPPE
jgi:hypothetical protein